jgi:hypothetical protein
LRGLGVEQPAGLTTDAIGLRLLQRRRLQQRRSLLGAGTGRPRRCGQGMGRIWSACAHTRPGRSFRIHSEDTRCATGVQRPGRPRFPVR